MKSLVILFICVYVADVSLAEWGDKDPEPWNLPEGYDMGLRSIKTRIIGGEKAVAPYQVALLWDGQPKDRAFCGGAIIDNNWILTSASCVTKIAPNGDIELKKQPEQLKVVVGGVDLDGPEAEKATLPVKKILPHLRYNENNRNDIALLKIEKDIFEAAGSIKLEKMELAEDFGDLDRLPGYATGYGETDREMSGRYSPKLQGTEVTIMRDGVCGRVYQKMWDAESMLCVGDDRGTSTCFGDGGGPLVLKRTRTLVGIASFGKKCGDPRIPEVYARIPALKEDIEEIMRKN